MAFAQFPAPAGGATEAAFAAQIPVIGTTYELVNDFTPGVYAVSIVPNTTNANLVFLNNSSILLNTVTASGAVSFVLSTTATEVYVTTKFGGSADAIVTITKEAGTLVPDDIGNGTVDVINASGTYNQTGLLNVLVYGGGGAGTIGNVANQGGDGGAAGNVSVGMFYVNSATTVTIGAKGTANNNNGGTKVEQTNSSFGNIISSTSSNFFNRDTLGGRGGYDGGGNPGTANGAFGSFHEGTTGGGGGGAGLSRSAQRAGGVGAGSGVGTGGNGGTTGGSSRENSLVNVFPTAGTGKASGGGGGASLGTNELTPLGRFGKDGTDGVVYVLRGF